MTTRRVRTQRRSRKRIFDLSACLIGFCPACAQRVRRVRLQDWHRDAMRANARHDRGWLDDLAAAQTSGFVHYAASNERLVATDPAAVDQVHPRLQFVLPRTADAP